MVHLNKEEANVIGGGLAGVEAAWQLAQRGVRVKLWEMRPRVLTPAHRTGYLAELVCSNSLRSNELNTGPGLLKEEMRRLGSLIIICADAHPVPAGGALAVDRERFARAVTERIAKQPLIELVQKEVTEIDPAKPTVIATGPLTSPSLVEHLKGLTGEEYLSFYDAAAPIVTAASLNHDRIFRASRYAKGEPAYLNCPMNEAEYRLFYEALIKAERHRGQDWEELKYFEGCIPVEVLAERGFDTLRYGPMKPVGLKDPRTGQSFFAVVQLRQDNQEGTLYNLVGFQTQLKWPDQARVFRLIPGLEEAEFVRYGVIHRNSYIKSPLVLLPTLQMRRFPKVFWAGQLTGVEGYIESASTGLVAGLNLARLLQGQQPLIFPPETAHGALCHYITTAIPSSFQPMNIAFGLFPPLSERIRDRRQRNYKLAERALQTLDNYVNF
ncbi:MAG: methylenetetrahydrofolate--tRNA-(uracil(54)-C(5))-methyltransferase (FADH(2)-oxidizing) TrmFO [Syntrophomonadaceae bacterium]|nr:methylenetetrahydrofolate--tRNA-(uracil(54)-C(5))-methyltransferase (FADH(2)-oxidizing) TrmFO [Syntrophomonadaceae bacterium]